MQSFIAQQQTSFLVATMSKYSSAVRNMEQTIMLPSLLQDIALEDQDEGKDASVSSQNLYECYIQLKSIKNIVESGRLPPEDLKQKINYAYNLEDEDEANLETLFYVHVKGLCTVLNSLTKKANMLTSRYEDVIGLSL
ncbi:mid1-interacting protein 1-B-like [Hemiscyllium ocellatum]|uniref:mid1-interacting protein 1-B-like n=1 Tax=Hemiscyllium ocellatum TaxID=170820 RepID=UPI002966F4CC|nr:mid1-interacting protein 1-B-like [Hemiscyllium ocellatum]